jgi:lupus La protein
MSEVKAAEVETKVASNGNTVELTKLETDIIRQLEYYFGDANLRRDKFLLEQISKEDGWVPVSTLLTFKRLKALSEDPKVIVDSIEKSTEGLIEISEDRSKLRRHPEHPLPEFNEETRKELQSRTCYAKGFPMDSEMSDLIDFFNGFEKVTNVLMRKYYLPKEKTYHFKGSVFATFATREQCLEFVKKAKVEYKGQPLIRKTQDDYLETKKKERAKADKKKAKKNQKQEEEARDIVLPVGTCLQFTTSATDKIHFKDIKMALSEVDPSKNVGYVDYSSGKTEGFIRFLAENDAKDFLDKLEGGKLKIKDTEFSFTLMDAEKEKEYLVVSAENIKTKLKEGAGRKQNQRKNKGKNRFNRKRKFEDNDDDDDDAGDDDDEELKSAEKVEKKDTSPPTKQAKTDEVTAE